ncbi:DUF4197 domain-containing protein [Pedobacter punctiformis]|uniref:DUF4197 domain-containing protein n=1 Tax=Pedobacter punctiformis TaxID=3004097 RepID=A0ABT4L7F8_9SPHI|nr:DUF4197 domain-containing protein [Pedobacter sp. HCMS5-2]MCZ4243078.1 DUF4197 domain-containing protein [Pedobacter sp. HCMS5-2]
MKSTTILASLALTLVCSLNAQSQTKLSDLFKKVTGKQTTTTTTASSSLGTPSTLEIGQGIKQALELGVSAGADRLSAKDGFLGNLAVKILMPPEAQKVEKTLRGLGLNSLCDNVITSLNRAAEDAAKEAKPIFVSAIKQMTLTDATNILLGNNDAATEYFKRVTTSQLMQKFSPIVSTSLSKVNATKYYSDLTSQYNRLPLVKPVNTNLSEYVTQKAIDGLFIEVAQEELKIRGNLGSRSTSLLQKVFGYADKKKI